MSGRLAGGDPEDARAPGSPAPGRPPFRVLHADEHEWQERPPPSGGAPRRILGVTTAGTLRESRARIWRYPPGVRGRRHRELAQEEVFVVLAGTLTMLLDDPPERVDLPPQSVVTVDAGTALQMRNESDEEVVVFVYGAPPVVDQSEYLDDVEL
jgi:mannose-6-phosphate isomerase-like protein (cupin superfamily)